MRYADTYRRYAPHRRLRAVVIAEAPWLPVVLAHAAHCARASRCAAFALLSFYVGGFVRARAESAPSEGSM